MVRVQDKQNLQRPLQRRVWPVTRLARPEQHVQEISRIAQVVVRIDVRHAQRVPVSERCNRRHLPNQSVRLFLARAFVENIFRIVIKSRKRRNRRNHHAHRVRVVMEAVQEFLDAFVMNV